MDDYAQSAVPTDLTAPVMPAGRAMAWVAFRDGLGPYRLLQGEAGRTLRWGGLLPQPGRPLRKHDLVHDVRWVTARVRWRKRSAGSARPCPLPPLKPEARSRLRGIARANGVGSVASLLQALMLDVTEARAALAEHSDRMSAAERALRFAAATGTLTAEGRRGWPRDTVRVGLETIAPAAWRDPLVRIVPNDFLWPFPSHGQDMRELPLFHDVQFLTAEILALWPAPPALAPVQGNELERKATSKTSATGVAGRPTSIHFVHLELARRRSEGLTLPKVSAEARHLADWFQQEHPREPQLQCRSIENAIRDAYNAGRSKSTEVPTK